jgi:hypothetical protein
MHNVTMAFGELDKGEMGQWDSGQWDTGQVKHGHVDKWRAHLNQTGGLQRLYNVSCDDRVDNDLGPGSGWQQSKQNRTRPAVMIC